MPTNEEHLVILKQGVEVWNRWREENPEVRPDLREAALSQAYLRGAHLCRTCFSRANLSSAGKLYLATTGPVELTVRLVRMLF